VRLPAVDVAECVHVDEQAAQEKRAQRLFRVRQLLDEWVHPLANN
jgi:hypothetical protein